MTDAQAPDNAEPSLRSRTARGVAWMMALKMAVRSLSVVSTLILVRLLAPEDFGIVAMAMVLIAIMGVFSWFSFDVVLIQKQDADRSHYDTAWTFNILFQALSSLLLILLAYPAALYYGEPRVTPLVIVLALGQFASGFGNIGIVNFRKTMQFNRDFKFMFLCKLAGFLVTLPLAFLLRNYWALICGQVFSQLFAVVASYVMEPYRPRFCLSARRELFHFSKWLVINNAFTAIRARATELIVGRVAGARDLGIFNISYELSNTPTTELVAPINRAVYPAYAKISGRLESLRSGYLSVIAVIALIAMPAGFGIGAVAKLIVPVALGDKWLDAIPLFTILAVSGAFGSLQTNVGSVFFALAKPHILTYVNALYLAVLLAIVIPATLKGGIEGAAFAHLATTLLMMPIVLFATFRTLKLPLLTFVSSVWRPLLCGGVMFFVVRGLVDYQILASGGAARLVDLAVAIGAGVIVYMGLVMAFWHLSGRPQGAESYVLETLLGRLSTWRQSRSRI